MKSAALDDAQMKLANVPMMKRSRASAAASSTSRMRKPEVIASPALLGDDDGNDVEPAGSMDADAAAVDASSR